MFENFKYPDKFGTWLGYKVLKIDRTTRTAEVELNLREDHLTVSGRIHGGVISAFFDFACGAAVFSILEKGQECATVELKVNYLRPLKSGMRLIAKSTLISKGKRLCVVHAMLNRENDSEPVGMATATFYVFRPPPASS